LCYIWPLQLFRYLVTQLGKCQNLKKRTILKKLITFTLFLVFTVSAFAEPQPTASIKKQPIAANDYLLAPGDFIEISVWKEESMQKEQILVAPDGNITFPLVGTIMAAGKPIYALEEALASKLADYIADPVVNIKLLQNTGNTIFVIGKVTKPGQYPANRRIDVMQALSLAGGLTVFADTGSIFTTLFRDNATIHVIRRVGDKVKIFPFDYDAVLKGKHLEQNILLEPGDTVAVP
jgi:polysaccharide biosynthesis/export protein